MSQVLFETLARHTDSIYEVPEQVTEQTLKELNIDQMCNTMEEQVEEQVEEPVNIETRQHYEVVFFVRYNINLRPSAEDLTTYFNKYGQVHHINCPNNKNFAFIFMTSLNIGVEHRRTRATIGQIIRDMTPETRFHITVASSNRGQLVPRSKTIARNENTHTIRYPSAEYSRQRPANRTNRTNQTNWSTRKPNNGSNRQSGATRTGTYHPEMFSFVRNTENGEIRRHNRK